MEGETSETETKRYEVSISVAIVEADGCMSGVCDDDVDGRQNVIFSRL